MSVIIEGLYILDDKDNCVLEHYYAGRPPVSKDLISRYSSVSKPRPSVLQLATLNPPTTVYSLYHSGLLLLCTSSKDVQALAVLEFLNRLVDVFEEFLGSPLLAIKIEENYEVVAQLLGEVCDGGVISTTESNSLRESVEVSSLIGKLFNQVGLPGSSPALRPSSSLSSALNPTPKPANGPSIPWRRPNVRHTSNELYVDIVEELSAIFAPSGRPITARASGSILFTAKISGVPDLLLTLSAPGGTSSAKSSSVSRTFQNPIFHPCVRLARWKDRPGELSFIPPDGKFMLAGYETDLLSTSLDSEKAPSQSEKLFLPAIVDLKTGAGNAGSDFEARLTLNNNFPGIPSSKLGPNSRTASSNTPFSFGSAGSGNSNTPTLEAVTVTIPFPYDVQAITDIKASRGEAEFNLSTKAMEWKVPTKDGASVNGVATLIGTILRFPKHGNGTGEKALATETSKTNELSAYYDDESIGLEQEHQGGLINETVRYDVKSSQGSQLSMPKSISVSFNVKGWLISGIKVESLLVDTKKSRGLGDGVKPYKGVKYLTVSRNGIERRV